MTKAKDGRAGLLTTQQVARQFGVQDRTVSRWRVHGLITPTGPWMRPYMYSPDEVNRLKKACVEPQYPEHDKLHEVKDASQAAGEFYTWLSDQGWHLVRYDHLGRPVPVLKPIRVLLAMWLGIDLAKIDEEKEQMLGNLRNLNKEAETE